MKVILTVAALVTSTNINAEIINAKYISNMSKSKTEYVIAEASKGSESGRINLPIELSSQHYISITNPTDRVIGWQYIFTLCVEDRGCFEKKFTKNLEPHTNFKDNGKLEGTIVINKQGQYVVYAQTKVIGDIEKYSDNMTSSNYIYVDN